MSTYLNGKTFRFNNTFDSLTPTMYARCYSAAIGGFAPLIQLSDGTQYSFLMFDVINEERVIVYTTQLPTTVGGVRLWTSALTVVYNLSTDTWTDEKYKTITFVNEPTDIEGIYQGSTINVATFAEILSDRWTEIISIPYLTTNLELSSIADAIRAKGGTSEELEFPNGFITAIQNL